jgi:hypothetical protein
VAPANSPTPTASHGAAPREPGAHDQADDQWQKQQGHQRPGDEPSIDSEPRSQQGQSGRQEMAVPTAETSMNAAV